MAEYGDITADDLNYFASSKRKLNDSYGYGLAQNQWQRSTVSNDYDRQLGDLKSQFAQSRDQLPTAYAHNGLLNSGIYARALDDFQAQQTRTYGNLAGQYNDQLSGLALADRQLEQVRSSGLSDVDAAEKARRATVAEALKNIGI